MSNQLTADQYLEGIIRAYYKSKDTMLEPLVKHYQEEIQEVIRYGSYFDKNFMQDKYNGLQVLGTVLNKGICTLTDYEWINCNYEPLTKPAYK